MSDFPEYMPYYAIKKYRYEGTPAANDTNRNLLLFRDPSGGWAEDRAHRGRRLLPDCHGAASGSRAGRGCAGSPPAVSVVLGTASENARANESQKLLNWGYTAFEAVKLFDAGQPVATPAASGRARPSTLKLGRPQGVVVAVPAGEARARLKTQVVRPDPLVAPFAQGRGRWAR
jgi:D-alanyl-D-alanine carboxypeptidase (penicillin-binding protein 5/6)